MAMVKCNNCGSSDYIGKTANPTSPSLVPLRCRKCGHEQACTEAEWDQYTEGLAASAMASVLPSVVQNLRSTSGNDPELAGIFAGMDARAEMISKARMLRSQELTGMEEQLSKWDSLSEAEKEQLQKDANPRWQGDFAAGSLHKGYLEPDEADRLNKIQATWTDLRTKDAVFGLNRVRMSIADINAATTDDEKRRLLKSANDAWSSLDSVLNAAQRREFRQLTDSLKSRIKFRWWEFLNR